MYLRNLLLGHALEKRSVVKLRGLKFSDGLEDLQDAAPDEIRKWLAATFSQENNVIEIL